MNQAIDVARLKLILNDLRLPAMKHSWPTIAEQSDKCSATITVSGARQLG